MRSPATILFSFLFISGVTAQQIIQFPPDPLPKKRIDSLIKVLERSKKDTSYILTLYELATHYRLKGEKKERIREVATETLELSQKLNYEKGICLAYFHLGLEDFRMKNYESALAIIEKISTISRQLDFKRGRGLVYRLYAEYYERNNNFDESIKYYLLAKEIFNAEGDKINLASSASQLGIIYMHRNNYPEAIKNLLIAASINKEYGYRVDEAYSYASIGNMFIQIGDYSLALDYDSKSLDLWKQIGELHQIAWSSHDIGDLYIRLNYDTLALHYFAIALKISTEIKDTIAIAENYNSIGEIYLKGGKYFAALDQFHQSLELFLRRPAYKGGIPGCYFNIGRTLEKRGDSVTDSRDPLRARHKYREALKNYFISLTKYQETGNASAAANVSAQIGQLQTRLKNYSEAQKYLSSALNISLTLGAKETIAKSYFILSHLDSLKGNYAKAFAHFKLHVLYQDSVYNFETLKKVEAAKLQNEFYKKEQEIKLLSAENLLKTSLASKRNQQKRFAYAVIALVILFGGYGFYRYQSRKKMEMAQAKMKDRLHISQGLHDDIGSTLSSISVYTQVAQKLNEKNNKEELSEMLGKINVTSSEMISEMNDIVWTIHPKNDSMEKIILRMESYAKPMLLTRNINFKLEYDPIVLATHLEMEKRKNFYLVFKEAVNNAFKYSGCAIITTRILNSKGWMEMEIKDNGVGFNVKHEMTGNKLTLAGNGLRNMKRRAEEMGGDLLINSSIGDGTEIRLSIPIP